MTNQEKEAVAKLRRARLLVQEAKTLGQKTLLWPEGTMAEALDRINEAIDYLER
jgi:hypothetical protein